MPGPLKTFFQMLGSSAFMNGVSLVFGDEEIDTQRFPIPCVVMVPRGGSYTAPGYARGLDPITEMIWEASEMVDLWLWNASIDPMNQAAIDHADSLETLRLQVLSGLQDQRLQYTDASNPGTGLQYKAMGERWEVNANAQSRYGRALVISVTIQISIPMTIVSGQATITSEQMIASVTASQHVK